MPSEASKEVFVQTHLFNAGLEKEAAELKQESEKIPDSVPNREHVYAQIKLNKARDDMRKEEVTPKHLVEFCKAVTLNGIAAFNEKYARTQSLVEFKGEIRDYSGGIAETYLGAAEKFKNLGNFFELLEERGNGLTLPNDFSSAVHKFGSPEIRFLVDMIKEGNEWTPPNITKVIAQLENMISEINDKYPVSKKEAPEK